MDSGKCKWFFELWDEFRDLEIRSDGLKKAPISKLPGKTQQLLMDCMRDAYDLGFSEGYGIGRSDGQGDLSS